MNDNIFAIQKSGLPLSTVFCPPPNLKDLLTKSRYYDRKCSEKECIICPQNKDGDCKRKGTVYCLKCECGAEYIGETGRELKIRINEHLKGLDNPSMKSYADLPLAIHRCKAHKGRKPSVLIKVLAYEPDIIRRKIVEATLIRKEQPTLNSKLELAEILSLLMPN